MTRQKLKEKYKDEEVFVVPFMSLSGVKNGFTFSDENSHKIYGQFDNAGKYVPRYLAEMDPSMQQIIPYILVYNPENDKYLVAKRIDGEKRLLDQIALGFGGHINPCDGTREVIFKALYRELNEEVDIIPSEAARFIGYIRDLNSPTNDHTGFVFIVSAKYAKIKEIDKLEGSWMSASELESNYSKFENWGRDIIDYLVAHDKKF
jgi:predicted NUDIX family phosphoesterase